MWCDSGGIIFQGENVVNLWHLRPLDEGVRRGRGGATTYVVSFPGVLQEVNFMVPGCMAVAHSVGLIHKPFMYRHLRSKVVVVQEGTEPLSCYDLCGNHMTAGQLIKHQRTAHCDKNT